MSVPAQPLVSVVVPTRNSADSLRLCLASIARQDYPAVKLVVVDNHSTDATLEIACSFTPHVATCGPERCAQRNAGAAMSTGAYLAFIDSDMVLDPAVIQQCVQVCMREPGVRGVIIPERSVGQGFWARCKALERSCYVGDDSIEAARFFDRGTFEEVGGYDEALIAAEDWDLSQRVAARGALRRIPAFISHLEGRLALRETMAGKFYYGRNLRRYIRKQPVRATRQFQLIRPAFIRHRQRLLAHPVLTTGMIVMKTGEFAAGGAGIALDWWLSSRFAKPSTHGRTPG